MLPGDFREAPTPEGDSESASHSEDWALHLTGGPSFYFSTAAANLWDQAKANTDVGCISKLLGKVSGAFSGKASPCPSTEC